MKNAPLKKQFGVSDQKQAFHLLHEFALRICVRYTGIEGDPEKTMYNGFAKLFCEWPHLRVKNLDFLKTRLRHILIHVCIETEINSVSFDQELADCSSFVAEPTLRINSVSLSDKKIIDILRTIPFSFRVIYNMSVIDGFSEDEISSTLHIPVQTVQCCLRLARKHLHEHLKHSLTKTAQVFKT